MKENEAIACIIIQPCAWSQMKEMTKCHVLVVEDWCISMKSLLMTTCHNIQQATAIAQMAANSTGWLVAPGASELEL